jgi:cytochrome c oxidase assembly factor CtaG
MKQQNQSALRLLMFAGLVLIIFLFLSGLIVNGHTALAACLIIAFLVLLDILALSLLLCGSPADVLFRQDDPIFPILFQRPPPCIA